ncbi:MAG: Abi family protein [Alphaproteobacteria bacterium]|nr:Abi family protein [Alphaproteobacteria bacterium]
MSKIISEPRFASYLRRNDGNINKAYQQYMYNLEVSAVLYQNIHWLEIALRNAINAKLREEKGDRWYHENFIVETERNNVNDIVMRPSARQPLSNADMVAQLNFGFWCGLFKNRYELLWRQELRDIFTCSVQLRRRNIEMKLRSIKYVRNRIAHYEPILTVRISQNQQATPDIVNTLIIDILTMLEFDADCYVKPIPDYPL